MKRILLSSFLSVGLVGLVAQAQVNTSEKAPPASTAQAHHADEAVVVDMPKHMAMMNKMMLKHLGEGDQQFDARFIDLMIPHHEGAVLTAKHALEHATHPEVKEMAAKMIKAQDALLTKWRKQWYGEAAPQR
jgi:uncharacterized protein (DUF305 family)